MVAPGDPTTSLILSNATLFFFILKWQISYWKSCFLKPAYRNALKRQSDVINQGKNIIVAQSSVFDVRDTDEKMVSKSTITLMALQAERLTTKPRTANGE
jgi:hypothetical protein